MWTQLWSSLGGKLADRWLSAAGPALVFWLGGLTAFGVGHGFDLLARGLNNLAGSPCRCSWYGSSSPSLPCWHLPWLSTG